MNLNMTALFRRNLEKTIWSGEIHGSVQLKTGNLCPVCGQKVALAAKPALDEKILSAWAAKRSGEGDGNSTVSRSTDKGCDQGEPA